MFLRFFISYFACILVLFFYTNIVEILGYPYEIEINELETRKHYLFYSLIFAPLWEELAFRYAPIELAKSISKKAVFPTITISSIFFGWMHHNNPESVMLQGSLGFILSWLYLKNGLPWSIFLHFLYNFTVIFLFE